MQEVRSIVTCSTVLHKQAWEGLGHHMVVYSMVQKGRQMMAGLQHHLRELALTIGRSAKPPG